MQTICLLAEHLTNNNFGAANVAAGLVVASLVDAAGVADGLVGASLIDSVGSVDAFVFCLLFFVVSFVGCIILGGIDLCEEQFQLTQWKFESL